MAITGPAVKTSPSHAPPLRAHAAARPPVNAWRRRFIARVVGATLLVQSGSLATFAWWMRPALGAAGAALASLALHALLSLIFVHRLVYWRDDVRAPWWRTWLIETPYTAFGSGAFLACAPSALIALGAWAMDVPAMPTIAALHVAGWALGAWGSTAGRAFAVVTRREVRVRGLPRALDGLRVAQLSDVHCGPYVPRWMYRRWAARASGLGADVIALTGDLITAGEGYLDDVRDFVAHLRAPHGVVACMGNHDYFGTVSGVADAVTAGGARLLRNESFALARDGAALWIAGIDDRWTKRDDLDAALRGVPEGAAVMLLAHDPASFPEAARRGVSLVLSGHTHGGQFGLPGWFERVNLARVITRFTAGLFYVDESALYVNRGIGTTGPPVRVGMWPEVSLLTLRSAP